jgi:predicted GNAT family N-acyltransferase
LDALDSYLRRQAAQDGRKHASVTFVLTSDGRTIAGYYTLSQFSIRLSSLPDDVARRLPRYPDIPATLLGRFAVSLSFQGKGLGEFLLMDALKRSLEAAKEIASVAVVVDAKDDSAKSFYKRYGFAELPEASKRLFLPIATIGQLFT